MSPVREASLTALREIRRNLGSTKGVAMFVLFVLGGALPSLLEFRAVKMLGVDPSQGMSADERRQLFEQLLTKNYEADTARHLSYCPPLLFVLFQLTLVFAPFFVLLIGFDQIAGDIQHRAIRYIAGRSRRGSIVAGKALGVWAVIAVMLLVLNVTVWIVMAATGSNEASAILSWGPRVWLFSVASCAAFVGLIALISSFFRTPMVAMFVGVLVFFGLWLTNKICSFVSTNWKDSGAAKVFGGITWALPFRYEDLLMSHDVPKVLGGFAGYLVWGVVMVALAAFVVQKRDI